MSLKTAVVTGANKGIGLEIVKQLCADPAYGTVYALCRSASKELMSLKAETKEPSSITVVEKIDVTKDDVGDILRSTFSKGDDATTKINLLVNNAGAYGIMPAEDSGMMAMLNSQSLDMITIENMRFSYELNTLGPLRVTKALLPNLTMAAAADDNGDEVGKVIIITSMMGSIADNTSGGSYAYRSAKAAVNMVGVSLARDLKEKKVSVGLIHPGMVATEFAGDGTPAIPGMHPVEPSVKGVLDAIHSISLESTGVFLHGNYGEGPKPIPW